MVRVTQSLMPRRSDEPDDEGDDMELPPLDADDDAPPPGADEEELDITDDEPGLDDAAADDLDVGGLLDDHRGDDGDGAADDAEADDKVDAGAEALLDDDEASAIGDDADGALVDDGDDDLDQLEGDEADGGIEGLDEPIENEVDEARLPASDADDGLDGVDAEGPLALLDDDAPLPPWAAERWTPRDGAGCEVPCVDLAVDGGCVVAVADPAGAAARRPGSALVVAETDLVPRSVEAPAGAVAVVATAGRIAVATARGAVVLLPSERAAGATLRAPAALPTPVLLAAAPGRVWVASGSTLSFFEIGDGPAVAVDVEAPADGEVVAIGASGATLVALLRAGATLTLARRRGDDAGWTRTEIDADSFRAVGTGVLALRVAASGAAIAVVGERGIVLLRDGRAPRVVALPGVVDACFCGERDDVDLAVLVERPTDGAAHVVRVPPAAAPALLARLPAPAADEGADDPFANARIAWDASRALLWVAAPSGLSAVGGAPRH